MSTPVEKLLDAVEWEPTPVATGEVPAPAGLYATHTGTLRIGSFSFRCFQLSDGRRVLHEDDVAWFFSQTGVQP